MRHILTFTRQIDVLSLLGQQVHPRLHLAPPRQVLPAGVQPDGGRARQEPVPHLRGQDIPHGQLRGARLRCQSKYKMKCGICTERYCNFRLGTDTQRWKVRGGQVALRGAGIHHQVRLENTFQSITFAIQKLFFACKHPGSISSPSLRRRWPSSMWKFS